MDDKEQITKLYHDMYNAVLEDAENNDLESLVGHEPKTAEPLVKVPFLVKVSISDLNIRKGPGTDYGRVQFCPIGVYTIVEVKSGTGSSAGWGRLKSGIGWVSLDYVKKV